MLKHITYSRCLLIAALAAALAIPLGSRLSKLDRVTARTDGRVAAYDAVFWGAPISFQYKAHGRTYSVDDVVWKGQFGDWSPNSQSDNFPVYVNRLFPSWWRWRPLRVPFSPAAMGGFVVLFILLWLKQKSAECPPEPDCKTDDDSESEQSLE